MKQNRIIYAASAMLVVVLGGGSSWRAFAEEPVTNEMCAEHHVGESMCPFCNPALIETDGFCSGHGVPEALCTDCRPALVEAFKAEGDWCAEHGVPESQCEACHPGIKKRWKQGEAKQKKRDPGRLWCKEHNIYEDECVICHPEIKHASEGKEPRKVPHDSPCERHHVAEAICPFCNPELIEEHGFCSGHGVPEALCTTCRPSLVEAFKAEGDWCAEHGVPESQCEACHPGVKDRWKQSDAKAKKPDAGRLWCREHNIYEDECVICHPEIKNKSGDAGSTELMCNEHGVPERECGICQPHLASELKPGESMKVRTVSPDSATRAGIATATPMHSEVSPHVKVLGEVRYNQNRLARITPLAAGVVQRVLVDVGQTVNAGDMLVELASSEVAEAKRDYVVAIMDQELKSLAHDREKQLLAKKIASEQDFQEAESEHKRARIVRLTGRQRVANLGFTDEEIAQIEETKSSSSLLVVRAPYSGTLVERAAVVGEAVEPGQPLFTLADLSTMWVELAVPETEAARVKTGLPVQASFQGLGDRQIEGELTWVHSRVDKRTRLIKARAEVPNPDGRLRDGMFGEVRVIVGGKVSTLRIPKESLQQFEQQTFVFVKAAEDLFELRRVVVGERNGNTVEIVRGIQPAEAIVAAGAFTMKSEFLKSRLGAGCVDD